jgi:hypothetical protein
VEARARAAQEREDSRDDATGGVLREPAAGKG